MRAVLGRLALLAGLAALAGMLFVWARGEDRAQAPAPARGPLHPGLRADAVVAIHLTLEQGHDLELRREPGGPWRITAPTTEVAREELVAQWLDNVVRADFAPLEQAGPPLSAADLGLEPPRHEFTIELQDGHRSTLLLGDLDPLGQDVYARVRGRDEIGLVTRSVVNLTRFPGHEWVEPRLLRGLRGPATRLKVERPEGLLIDAVRRGDQWILRGPEPVLPDELRVSKLLRSLTSVTAEAVAVGRPTPEQLAQFGFPSRSELEAGALHGCTRIEIGNDTEGVVWAALPAGWAGRELTPALRHDGDKLVTVPSAALAMLRNDFEFFRDHSVLPPVAERARSLRIESDGAVVLDVGQSRGGGWAFAAPERLAGQDVETRRRLGRSPLDELIGRLDDLEVLGFLPPPAGAPEATITVGWDRAGVRVLDRIELFAPDAQGRVPARASPRPREGLLLPAAVLALLDPLRADELTSLAPLAIEPGAWAALEVRHPRLASPARLQLAADGSWSGDDAWGRLRGLGHDLVAGFSGVRWQRARPDAKAVATVTLYDDRNAALAEIGLRPPEADEPTEALGEPVALARIAGRPGLELVVAREWLDRADEIAAARGSD